MLVAEINCSEQYVIKTSLEKMKIASEMCNGGPLAKEFCYFDGKVKRTHNFASLAASAYHPYLRKQILLATMEYKAEDRRRVTQFWELFNNCYTEANETENKFEPNGWCTDMAAAHMNILRDVYGYDVISEVKGSMSIRLNINMFKVSANKLLTSETRAAYNAAFDDISNSFWKQQGLKAWLSWWHERRHIIFRGFKSGNAPRSNLADVIQ